MDRKLITTEDGSHSFYLVPENEGYHSKHGALQESKHIFIEAGLKLVQKREISIILKGLFTEATIAKKYFIKLIY